MNLPSSFNQTILRTFGDRGRDFLASLPDLLAEAARRWQLTEIEPVANLSYNFVAYARRGKTDVVLKLGLPNPELTSEMTALALFDGRGAARLLDADAARGRRCLLERLRPGKLPVSLKDDARATHIAADLMLALRCRLDSHPGLIQLRDWFKGFERLRALRWRHRTAGPRPGREVRGRLQRILRRGLRPHLDPRRLAPFQCPFFRTRLAIDPKGVIGPAAYEVGPFLINPWIVSGVLPETPKLIQSRISILSERLGLEKQLIREWALAHAVLSAWWSLEDHSDWKPAIACAATIANTQP